jgi:hypothetical protein
VKRKQQPDRGRLAGAVGPEKPEHLTGFDAQIETVDRERRTVRLRHPERLDGGGHCWIICLQILCGVAEHNPSAPVRRDRRQ